MMRNRTLVLLGAAFVAVVLCTAIVVAQAPSGTRDFTQRPRIRTRPSRPPPTPRTSQAARATWTVPRLLG